MAVHVPAPGAAHYFVSASQFGAWLQAHGAIASEVLVGFHKVGSGLPSMTWPQSVDEALCRGWIDGVRKRVDDLRYTIRFSPRRASSIWSAVNIARVAELTAQGRMQPAGLAAFERRRDSHSRVYAYEQADAASLTAAQQQVFEAAPAAWAFFSAQSPSYRQRCLHWVGTAAQASTRERRLMQLITLSAAGHRR
jgi:uncharacterized protein YdeI (YjbR/CyaY-like superfamily)